MNIGVDDPRKKYFPGVVQRALFDKLAITGELKVQQVHAAYTVGNQAPAFLKKLISFGVAREKVLGVYSYIPPLDPKINDELGKVQVGESKP